MDLGRMNQVKPAILAEGLAKSYGKTRVLDANQASNSATRGCSGAWQNTPPPEVCNPRMRADTDLGRWATKGGGTRHGPAPLLVIRAGKTTG